MRRADAIRTLALFTWLVLASAVAALSEGARDLVLVLNDAASLAERTAAARWLGATGALTACAVAAGSRRGILLLRRRAREVGLLALSLTPILAILQHDQPARHAPNVALAQGATLAVGLAACLWGFVYALVGSPAPSARPRRSRGPTAAVRWMRRRRERSRARAERAEGGGIVDFPNVRNVVEVPYVGAVVDRSVRSTTFFREIRSRPDTFVRAAGVGTEIAAGEPARSG